MPEEKKGEKKATVSVDLGFGGLFKGLGEFLDVLSDMVEVGEEEGAVSKEGIHRRGEFTVKGMEKAVRGVYGFSVRTGLGGAPKVERFGNIRATDKGPVVAEVREPLVDVFDEGQEIVVVAELPGVTEDEIHVEVRDDILSLETNGERKYAKEVLLPQAVQAGTLQRTYKNGIVELRLKKA